MIGRLTARNLFPAGDLKHPAVDLSGFEGSGLAVHGYDLADSGSGPSSHYDDTDPAVEPGELYTFFARVKPLFPDLNIQLEVNFYEADDGETLDFKTAANSADTGDLRELTFVITREAPADSAYASWGFSLTQPPADGPYILLRSVGIVQGRWSPPLRGRLIHA